MRSSHLSPYFYSECKETFATVLLPPAPRTTASERGRPFDGPDYHITGVPIIVKVFPDPVWP